MRESVGSTWIFLIAITFTIIFAGFLVMALSYSRTYKEKNELTSIIEKYEGLTTKTTHHKNIDGSINVMNTYLRNNNYNRKGFCQKVDSVYEATDTVNKMYGFDIDGTPEIAQDDKRYDYCVLAMTNYETCNTIFRVTVFFDFNLPVFGDLVKFRVSGQTNEIMDAYIMDEQTRCKK